jgi:uncharacterized low-complexity protein
MSNKIVMTPLSVALGAAFVTSLADTSVANAAENPFAMTELSSGYMVAEQHEGKCGGATKAEEGATMKEGEGTGGGAMKPEEAEGEHGAGKVEKEAEGKCGEGKCGAGK